MRYVGVLFLMPALAAFFFFANGACVHSDRVLKSRFQVVPFASAATPLAVSVSGGEAVNITNYASDYPAGNVTTVIALLDVFVDGSVMEVFANEGEAAITQIHPGATTTNASLAVAGPPGGTIGYSISGWEMAASVQ